MIKAKMYFIFYFNTKQIMLSQRNKDKENNLNPQPLKTGNILYKAIEVLKQDKQTLFKQNEQRERFHEEQKKKLRIQIQGFKRKIAQLTQANILNSIIKKDQFSSKVEAEYAEKIKRLELEVEHYRSIIAQKDKSIQNHKTQIKQLERKTRQINQEKQKHLQISLTQKIMLDQKISILQKQSISKKKIIEGLKRQIEKVNKLQFQIGKKQRQIVKRGRDMNKYQQQFQSYYAQNQRKFQRRIEALEQQNKFLRKQFKKIAKKVKNTCHCEGEAEEWKQKLYQVGKQLARARVQLSRNGNNRQIDKLKIKNTKQNGHHSNQSDDIQQSIGSLTLSDQSSFQQDAKATQKKKF